LQIAPLLLYAFADNKQQSFICTVGKAAAQLVFNRRASLRIALGTSPQTPDTHWFPKAGLWFQLNKLPGLAKRRVAGEDKLSSSFYSREMKDKVT